MIQETTPQNEELTRLEILRGFKKHFAGDGNRNRSPFEEGRVVGYGTDIDPWDVPEIHHTVRETIQEHLRAIHQGKPSQVVILAGEPGMGKSHLLNYFRSSKRADELGYVFVCNSNHWKVQEFEECLLDWILEALVRPSPNGPHLLLEKIQDVAFQALSQILARPGYSRKFQGSREAGLLRRVFTKLAGSGHARLQAALEKRDASVFKRLDFARFSSFVCDRFLQQSGNLFHRYVLQVLLRYLYPEDREKTLHWLRRKNVRDYFLKALGAEDVIDRQYKVIDTIKILISLFTPEVSRTLGLSPASGPGKVFFFAFDQLEGRQELFEQEDDWFKFFAQLSELYNSLPNVFVLFTMTLGLRDKLYPKMERQFQQRIRRDQKFVLREIDGTEVLSVYRRRVRYWLGDGADTQELRNHLDDPRFQYLPFSQEEILDWSRTKTLREILDDLDGRFRRYLDREVTGTDPRFEFLVSLNELRRDEEDAHPFHYTESHLDTVTELLNRAGGFFASAYGLSYCGLEAWNTEDGLPALRLEFRPSGRQENWVRVFLTRLPYQFNAKLQGCFKLLHKLQIDRNFLWLLRPDKVVSAWETERPGQVFARTLPLSTQTSVQAVLRLLDKRERFPVKLWKAAEQVLLEEFKLTYLGEMFQEVANVLEVQVPEQPMVLIPAEVQT
jgi:hypothetical protein